MWRAPIIFNSPHSGSVYPSEFLKASRIDLPALRRSEDSFMDELIGGLSDLGFPTVRVNFPRSYVDVNREPYELDPRMFAGRLPSFANTRSMRVAGGLGTIPRVVGDGQEIYRERLSIDDGLARIEAFYKPYHRALRRLINKAHQAFGTVVVVDCHSMPSVGVSPGRATAARRGDRRPLRHQLRGAAARHGRGNHEPAGLFGRTQQALCRRFHHRALRQSRQRAAHHPARTQPRDLHGRAAARTRREVRTGRPPISPRWRTRWPPFRSATSGRSRPRRSNARHSRSARSDASDVKHIDLAAAIPNDIRKTDRAQEKGPLE